MTRVPTVWTIDPVGQIQDTILYSSLIATPRHLVVGHLGACRAVVGCAPVTVGVLPGISLDGVIQEVEIKVERGGTGQATRTAACG
jgi:hypothetical protein